MEIEYLYYLAFSCLILIAVSKKGRSILANAYWAVDKKYFDLQDLSRDESLSVQKRGKNKALTWLIMAAIWVPIITLFVSIYYLRLSNKGIL